MQAARVVAGIKEGVTASQEGSGATLSELKAEAEAAQATEVLDGEVRAGGTDPSVNAAATASRAELS